MKNVTSVFNSNVSPIFPPTSAPKSDFTSSNNVQILGGGKQDLTNSQIEETPVLGADKDESREEKRLRYVEKRMEAIAAVVRAAGPILASKTSPDRSALDAELELAPGFLSRSVKDLRQAGHVLMNELEEIQKGALNAANSESLMKQSNGSLDAALNAMSARTKDVQGVIKRLTETKTLLQRWWACCDRLIGTGLGLGGVLASVVLGESFKLSDSQQDPSDLSKESYSKIFTQNAIYDGDGSVSVSALEEASWSKDLASSDEDTSTADSKFRKSATSGFGTGRDFGGGIIVGAEESAVGKNEKLPVDEGTILTVASTVFLINVLLSAVKPEILEVLDSAASKQQSSTSSHSTIGRSKILDELLIARLGCLRILNRLSKFASLDSLMCKRGALRACVSVIADCLQRWKSTDGMGRGAEVSGDSISFSLGVLKNCTLVNSMNRRFLVSEKVQAIEAMTDILKTPPAGSSRESMVVAQALSVLRNLAVHHDIAIFHFLPNRTLESALAITSICPQDREVMFNLTRLACKLTIYPDFADIFAKKVVNALEILKYHPNDAQVITRVCYAIGNAAAISDPARSAILLGAGSDLIASLLQAVSTRTGSCRKQLVDMLSDVNAYDLYDTVKASKEGSQHKGRISSEHIIRLEQEVKEFEELEDALVKIVRVLANCCVSQAVALHAISKPSMIQTLLNLLSLRAIEFDVSQQPPFENCGSDGRPALTPEANLASAIAILSAKMKGFQPPLGTSLSRYTSQRIGLPEREPCILKDGLYYLPFPSPVVSPSVSSRDMTLNCIATCTNLLFFDYRQSSNCLLVPGKVDLLLESLKYILNCTDDWEAVYEAARTLSNLSRNKETRLKMIDIGLHESLIKILAAAPCALHPDEIGLAVVPPCFPVSAGEDGAPPPLLPLPASSDCSLPSAAILSRDILFLVIGCLQNLSSDPFVAGALTETYIFAEGEEQALMEVSQSGQEWSSLSAASSLRKFSHPLQLHYCNERFALYNLPGSSTPTPEFDRSLHAGSVLLPTRDHDGLPCPWSLFGRASPMTIVVHSVLSVLVLAARGLTRLLTPPSSNEDEETSLDASPASRTGIMQIGGGCGAVIRELRSGPLCDSLYTLNTHNNNSSPSWSSKNSPPPYNKKSTSFASFPKRSESDQFESLLPDYEIVALCCNVLGGLLENADREALLMCFGCVPTMSVPSFSQLCPGKEGNDDKSVFIQPLLKALMRTHTLLSDAVTKVTSEELQDERKGVEDGAEIVLRLMGLFEVVSASL